MIRSPQVLPHEPVRGGVLRWLVLRLRRRYVLLLWYLRLLRLLLVHRLLGRILLIHRLAGGSLLISVHQLLVFNSGGDELLLLFHPSIVLGLTMWHHLLAPMLRQNWLLESL